MIPLDEVKQDIATSGYSKVLFHLPAGLMSKWQGLSELVPEAIFVADPCFGACDIPFHLLEKFEADAVFSFGHSRPATLKIPDNIHFFEVELDFNPDFIPSSERIGLVYVIQYRKAAEKYANKLRKLGKTVVMGGKPGFMATYDGQITGCDIVSAQFILNQVDSFVICSDGHFHSQAVAGLGKPTFNWLGEKAKAPKYPVALLSSAKTVGIIVSSKTGQFNLKAAKETKQELEKLGKTVIMVAGDKISDEIENFKVDFWIVTACPRIAQDRPKSAPLEPANVYIKGIYK